MIARTSLRLLALIYIVRFAFPALTGASGAVVFGEPWLLDGQAVSPLLDSDIRYWGVTTAAVAAVMFVLSFDIRRHLVVLDLLMIGALAGAGVRTWEIFALGGLPGPAMIAAGVEWLFPLAWFASTLGERRAKRYGVDDSIEVNAPKAVVWGLFADFGGVDDWHPYMQAAQLLEGPDEGVGARRHCEFGPKMAIVETVEIWDEGGMTIGIDFVKGIAPPISDIKASVRVEPLGEARCRLTLAMSFKAGMGPLGGVMSEMFIHGQYRSVFEHMLAAVAARAEGRPDVPPVVMPMSGRQLAA